MADTEICAERSKKKKNRGCFIGCCCSESNDDISEANISSIMTMVDVIDTLSLEVPQNTKSKSTPCVYSRFSTCPVFFLSNTNGTSPLNALQ